MSEPLDYRLPLLVHPPHPALLILLDAISIRYGSCIEVGGTHWLLTEPLTAAQRDCLDQLQRTIGATSQPEAQRC